MFNTTITWYDPSEKLPDTSRKVLCVTNERGEMTSLSYSKVNNAFNSFDGDNGKCAFDIALWAEVPQKLKGHCTKPPKNQVN